MDIHPLILVGVFVAASVLGYIIIKKVPSLLHTPLMSGMNALSGITILGAMIAAAATEIPGAIVLFIVALLAAALAAVNVVGGFAVTHRMLMMFSNKKNNGEEK